MQIPSENAFFCATHSSKTVIPFSFLMEGSLYLSSYIITIFKCIFFEINSGGTIFASPLIDLMTFILGKTYVLKLESWKIKGSINSETFQIAWLYFLDLWFFIVSAVQGDKWSGKCLFYTWTGFSFCNQSTGYSTQITWNRKCTYNIKGFKNPTCKKQSCGCFRHD